MSLLQNLKRYSFEFNYSNINGYKNSRAVMEAETKDGKKVIARPKITIKNNTFAKAYNSGLKILKRKIKES